MRRTLRTLEEPYRGRAIAPGTIRHWSWLFAARGSRGPLLGIYALAAEWHALLDPATEPDVARIKLAWWREEVERLAAGSPLHPICRYLADLPGAAAGDWGQLAQPLAAAAEQVAGAPLERASDLQSHAGALFGIPLLVAARLAGPHSPSVQASLAPLARAQYLSRALGHYGREARVGRIPFPVDELLGAGIDNDALAARDPPPRLERYLQGLRAQAAADFASADAALAPADRSAQRHLLVLATLGVRHLNGREQRADTDFRLADLYNAWSAARRAAAAR